MLSARRAMRPQAERRPSVRPLAPGRTAGRRVPTIARIRGGGRTRAPGAIGIPSSSGSPPGGRGVGAGSADTARMEG
eukprot:11068356-Alexandrium_andersonii.AAC.1